MISKKPSRRKCAICREWFHPQFQNERWCCPEHGAKLALQLRAKAVAKAMVKCKAQSIKVERAAKAELRKRKEAVKPIGYWMKRAQSSFNAWIRGRDSGLPCISCGRFHSGQNHAGHYRPAGSNPDLRFEPDNCHLQCAPCNAHLSGNLTNYRPALIAKIGLERVEWLEGPHEPKRYRKEDYQAIEAEYKAKLKELQKNQS